MGTYCIAEDIITILVKKEIYKLSIMLDIWVEEQTWSSNKSFFRKK